MTAESGPAEPSLTAALDAQAVIDYLRAHPGFLQDHPQVCTLLDPPGRHFPDPVVDMQAFLLDRLRHELDRTRDRLHGVVAASRANMTSQQRIHAAVIALCDTADQRAVVRVLTECLPEALEVDALVLVVEEGDSPLAKIEGVRVVPAGTLLKVLGEGRQVLLRGGAEVQEAVFGDGAGALKSEALLRLDHAGLPPCLVAFGARQADRFHEGQGTELLTFLGGVIAASLAHRPA